MCKFVQFTTKLKIYIYTQTHIIESLEVDQECEHRKIIQLNSSLDLWFRTHFIIFFLKKKSEKTKMLITTIKHFKKNDEAIKEKLIRTIKLLFLYVS